MPFKCTKLAVVTIESIWVQKIVKTLFDIHFSIFKIIKNILFYFFINKITLSSHQNQGNFLHVSILTHFGIIVVDGVKTGLVFKAKDKDYRIHPWSELKKKRINSFNCTLKSSEVGGQNDGELGMRRRGPPFF